MRPALPFRLRENFGKRLAILTAFRRGILWFGGCPRARYLLICNGMDQVPAKNPSEFALEDPTSDQASTQTQRRALGPRGSICEFSSLTEVSSQNEAAEMTRG